MNATASAAALLELLDRDELDAAIEAGLAEFDPDACASLPPAARERLRLARDRLLQAWAARDRHRARGARLARDAEELRARRTAAATATAGARGPSLPPAAAAALERARQRARGGAN